MFQRVLFLVVILAWVLICSIYSYSIQLENKKYELLDHSVNAEILTPININQKSILLAMNAYSIKAPKECMNPSLNLDLEDRGITVKQPWKDDYTVEIGPLAFENWSVLGSTLAHEIEVHCNQNFVLINLLNIVGLDGTGFAERSAYNYEIVNQDRFGTSSQDILSLNSIREHYYPYPSEEKQPEGIYNYFENLFTEFFSLTI